MNAQTTARPPKISVVVPTYNRARDVGRCLQSLVGQTFEAFEVLVCDDGSTDDTSAVVDAYKTRLSLTYVRAENFGGPARPRNAGLRLARGEYIAFLDSDDWWTPEKLQRSLEHLERGADVVYHDMYFVARAAQRLFPRKSRGRQLAAPVFEDLLVNGNALNNSSVVARRSLLQSIGGCSEERALIAAEDYDLWLRLAQVTDAFVRIPHTLGFYWVGSGNLSNPQRMLMNLDALEERYRQELATIGRRRPIHWIQYARARAHLDSGAYELARRSLQQASLDDAPALMRLKCLWVRLLSSARS